jgi:hypothetical protein
MCNYLLIKPIIRIRTPLVSGVYDLTRHNIIYLNMGRLPKRLGTPHLEYTASKCRITEEWSIWDDFYTIPTCQQAVRKIKKPLRIDNASDKFRTKNLPNTSLEVHRYASLLGYQQSTKTFLYWTRCSACFNQSTLRTCIAWMSAGSGFSSNIRFCTLYCHIAKLRKGFHTRYIPPIVICLI